jgi:predicted MFS family arabinose efflux permease
VVRLLPYSIIPPVVGLIGDKPADFRHILVMGGLMMLLSLAMIPAIKSAAPAGASDPKGVRTTGMRDLFMNLKDRKVATLLVVQLLLYSSYTIVFFFLKEYASGRGIENPGFFFTVATAAMIGVRVTGSAFFDRFNKALITGASMAGLAACYFALGYVANSGAFYALALFSGLGWGIVMPMVIALMFDISAPRLRSMNLNLSLLMMQGGFFVGPFAGGLLVSGGGYHALFIFTACLSLFASGLVWIIFKRRES